MKTKNYTVRIIEILEKDIEVVAENEADAIDNIKKQYNNEDIVLDSNDFSVVNFDTVRDKKQELQENKCPHCDVVLEAKMIDVDGTNLEEHKICPDCGYGTPALR